jgi:hypothetical protein
LCVIFGLPIKTFARRKKISDREDVKLFIGEIVLRVSRSNVTRYSVYYI